MEKVCFDSETLLDDVEFSKKLLSKDGLSRADMVFALRNLLRLKYYPVAVKYFYSEEEVEEFRKNKYKIGIHPFTFCHFSAVSRQRGEIVFSRRENLGCSNARYLFGWKDFDENEIKSHKKYTRDLEQAERFVKTKPRLPEGLKALATAPLHKAPFEPDLIHIICDVLQSYHLYNDYASAMDVHPIQPNFMMNSAVCGGAVWTYVNKRINIVPMCSGSYTAGKTEQGEINVFIPWEHFEPTVRRLLERTVRDGGPSFPRTGETYPGFDLCKLCNFLIFKEPKC
ncbi:Uncharacterized protein conserved in archaea [Archaeoglobus sulfaticallidus PM70-1]|uniref:Uncharacterized protein conserved in archaea n=1 Tax=Archaeoglobus sulfaticallidus PM70-1 TaxID=387631 RepID=N0BLT8_9EURY|nr:DUF169 domain-containing protein [Archaeoglobus sulfaticallidus]AGK61215.1 Uncharacterized protein conserved in archaea [Archaeoglobus sulfaticallidus PM70-1]